MMPSAKIDACEKAPPENISRSCIRPLLFVKLARAAWNMDRMWLPLAETEHVISGEYVYAYPPGIAVLAPGEVIDSRVIRDITKMVEAGRNVIRWSKVA